MPWTTEDVDRHKKGLGNKQKETWVEVANGALKSCLDKGGKQDECEASAIRQANEVAGEQSEAEPEPGGPDKCTCPDCDYEVSKKRGTPCRAMKCPKCGSSLVAGTEGAEEMPELAQIAASAIETALALVNDSGELDKKQANALLEALRGDLEQATAEGGSVTNVTNNYNLTTQAPAGSIMEVMTIIINGESVPLSELIDTYRRLQEAPAKIDFSEAAVGIDMVRAVLAYLVAQLPDEEDAGTEGKTKESALAESASGAAIGLVEAEPAADGARAPLLLDVALIRPGWGNKRDNHYYSRELLRRDAKVFEGVKMYATDHRQDEKSVRTEVASVKQIVGFTDDGAPIARVAVHDPDFAEATRNRAQLDTLNKLECSILARGPTRPGEMDGRKGYIVEAITAAQSVDWVTSGGAGGHALNLAESATDGGESMGDEKKVEEQGDAQGQGQTEAHVLSEDKVASILGGSKLPDPARERLIGAEYEDEEAVEAAVQREVEYLKEITGSGKPFAQGQTQPPAERRISEADLQKQFDAIDGRHGLYVEVNK